MNSVIEFNCFTNCDRYEDISDEEVYRKIEAVEERQQLLHHCAIWDLCTGVHLVGNKQSEVIQATEVEFDEKTLESYVKVINEIKEEFLFWAYNDSKKFHKK